MKNRGFPIIFCLQTNSTIHFLSFKIKHENLGITGFFSDKVLYVSSEIPPVLAHLSTLPPVRAERCWVIRVISKDQKDPIREACTTKWIFWTLTLIWQHFFRWFPHIASWRSRPVQSIVFVQQNEWVSPPQLATLRVSKDATELHRMKIVEVPATRNSANVPCNKREVVPPMTWNWESLPSVRGIHEWTSPKAGLDVRIHESSYAYSQDWVSLQQTFREETSDFVNQRGDRNHSWQSSTGEPIVLYVWVLLQNT